MSMQTIDQGVFPKEQNAEQKTNHIQDTKVRDARFSISSKLTNDMGEADISGAEAGETRKILVREKLREELIPLSEVAINRVIAEYEQLVNHYSRGESGSNLNKHRSPSEKNLRAEHEKRMKAIAEAQKKATALAKGIQNGIAIPEAEQLATAVEVPQARLQGQSQAIPISAGQRIQGSKTDQNMLAITRGSLQQEQSIYHAQAISIDAFFRPDINELNLAA